jgi:hypothetical protein
VCKFPGMSDQPDPKPRKRVSTTALGIGAAGLVVLVVVVLVLVSVSASPKKQLQPTDAPAGNLIALVTDVPESVFEQVGLPSELDNRPEAIVGQHPLEDHGLPEVLYVGAEYCPFCAAERWAMVMALSKFGSFSGLRTIYSSALDYAPDTPTFTFDDASYTSRYLAFQGYEIATNEPAAPGATCNVNGYGCLDIPPSAEIKLFEKVGGSNFPFVDFGNVLAQAGAGFEGQPLLLDNHTPLQVAEQLHDPSSPIAQAEDGSANYMTAAICKMTGNVPTAVCSVPVVRTAEAET